MWRLDLERDFSDCYYPAVSWSFICEAWANSEKTRLTFLL
jgi:hypothetical protein